MVDDLSSIRSLIDSPEELASMGEQALAYIHEPFDWGRTVEQYLKVYDDLLGITGAATEEGCNAVSLNKMEAG